jgi:hypothetical protein
MAQSKNTKNLNNQSEWSKSWNILENSNIDNDNYLWFDKSNYTSEKVKNQLLKLLDQKSYKNLKLILDKFSYEQLISRSNTVSKLCCSNTEIDKLTCKQLISLSLYNIFKMYYWNIENLKLILDKFSYEQLISLPFYTIFQLCYWNIKNLKLILDKFSYEQLISLSDIDLFILLLFNWNIENIKLILDKFSYEQLVSLSDKNLFILCYWNIENLKLILDKFSYEQLISLPFYTIFKLCYWNIENLKLILDKFSYEQLVSLSDKQSIWLSNIRYYWNYKNLKLILNKFDDIISIEQLCKLSDIICCRTNNNLKILLWEENQNNINENVIRCCTNLTLDDLIIYKNVKFCNLKDLLALKWININLHSYIDNEYWNSLNFVLSWWINSRMINNLKILKDKWFGDNNYNGKYNEIIKNWPLVVAWAKNSDLQLLERNDVNTLYTINNNIIKDLTGWVIKTIWDLTEKEKSNYFRKLHLKEYLDNNTNITIWNKITRKDLLKASLSMTKLDNNTNITIWNKITRRDWWELLKALLSMTKEEKWTNNSKRGYHNQHFTYLEDLCSIDNLDKWYENISLQMILNYLVLDFELSRDQSIMWSINPDWNSKPLRHFDYSIIILDDNRYKIMWYKKKWVIQVELFINNDENNNIYSINWHHINYGDIDIEQIKNSLEYNINIMMQDINLRENFTCEFRNSNLKMVLELYKLCILFLERLKKNKRWKFNSHYFEIFYKEKFPKWPKQNIYDIYKVVEGMFKINYSEKVYSIIRELYANVYWNKTILPALYKLRNAMEHGNFIIWYPNTVLFFDDKNNYYKYNIDILVFYCNDEYSWLNYL